MGETSNQKIHAIMIPSPFQGHVNPFAHLAVKLATQGFTITFVNTQSIHHQISRASSSCGNNDDPFTNARASGLDIRYRTISDGLPIKFDRSSNYKQFMICLLHVLSAHVDELVGEIVASQREGTSIDPPLTCLIADTFYVWGSMIANKYKLVHISFWTEPALVLTLCYHLDLLNKNGHYGNGEKWDDIIDYIPGVQAIKPTDMMSFLQETDTSTTMHQIINLAFEDVKKADMILCNTIYELEPETISALHQKQPVYAIGPIFPSGFTKSNIAMSLWSESDCTHWLDKKPKDSVLYVSFGSFAHSSKHDIVEIAHGLLLSGVSFIWVLRADIVSSDKDFLPVGFEENVKDRGLIVPWCNQIGVLSHSAMGGFLTHCGWNSILESMWCGVPLLCYPLLTDQFTNRKLVVDDWRIGLNLSNKNSISREEVAENTNHLMSGETSKGLREEMKKMKRTLEHALGTDGSSTTSFNQFIKDVKDKITIDIKTYMD